MKKTISLLLVLVMAAALAACSSKPEEVTVPEEPATAETAAEETAGMANPMVEVQDTGDFQKELGIDIDANLLYSDAKLFIISGTIAECQFSFEDVMGNPVDCSLRATRDTTVAENLHGIFGSLEDQPSEKIRTEKGDLDIRYQRTETGETHVFTWQIDDIYYSLVVMGLPNEMELADVKESAMSAVGVEPLAEEAPAAAEENQAPMYEVSEDGELLTVRFPANPTTGYEWTGKIWSDATLEQVESFYEQTPGTEGLAGAGGIWTASYRSVKDHNNYGFAVSNYIEFIYSRKWEGEAMPSRVVDVIVTGPKIEITGIHEPDFECETAPDGTYDVQLEFTDMIEENELSFYALVEIPETIVLSDEQVKALKPGDTIDLSGYGLDGVTVDRLEKESETSIAVNDCESLRYREDRKGWIIVGLDDDIYTARTGKYKVHFTNESEITDQMEEVLKTGNSGTIYDKMRDYSFVNATVTVKDGFVSAITIHYHP